MRAHGKASVSTMHPQAFAICDRCGFLYNHINLSWQFDYAGAGLINKQILVCRSCKDDPQMQRKAFVVAQDPVPILNPRVQDDYTASVDSITINAPKVYDKITGIPIPPNITLITQNGAQITTQPLGRSSTKIVARGNQTGLDYNAQVGIINGVNYRKTLTPTAIFSVANSNVITVNFSSAHGLLTNSQIAVEGLSKNEAVGFYSITVTTATQFTYNINVPLSGGNLLTSATLMITGIVGLPYGYDKIPLTGS